MTTQEKDVAPAARKMPPKEETQAQDGRGGDKNGEVDEHTKLGHVLGRAGTAVGDSLTGLTRRGDGDANGGDANEASKPFGRSAQGGGCGRVVGRGHGGRPPPARAPTAAGGGYPRARHAQAAQGRGQGPGASSARSGLGRRHADPA